MKFLNFLIVILSLSVESVLSDDPCSAGECRAGRYCNVNGNCARCRILRDRASCFDGSVSFTLIPPKDSATCASVCFDMPSDPCDGPTCSPSNCVNGVYSGPCDKADCCPKECKRRAICKKIDDTNDDEKKKRQCQRRKSTCRFVPNNLSIDDELGVDGECKIKMPEDDVCRTFGGGCISSTTTRNGGQCFVNDCFSEESRKCLKNGCDYKVWTSKGGGLGLNDGARGMCVSKQDDCEDEAQCTEANGCALDPCSNMCSRIQIDCKTLSKDDCISKERKYQCRYNKNTEKCLNQ